MGADTSWKKVGFQGTEKDKQQSSDSGQEAQLGNILEYTFMLLGFLNK